MKKFLLFIFIWSSGTIALAQSDTLPDVSVKKKAGIVTISWLSKYKNASQINIQRSKDSNRNFITIHSTPNPNSRSYSFEDKLAKYDTGYYRVFVLFEGSNYIFTKPKRAIEDNGPSLSTSQQAKDQKTPSKQEVVSKDQPTVSEPEQTSVNEISGTGPVTTKRKDNKKVYKIPLPSSNIPVKKEWIPSTRIYIADDGNVEIYLPDAEQKNYSVTFLREEGRPVFALSQIKQTRLKLDKASFLTSGWYYFELRESGKVIEHNKFLITRDY
jgi:hypothetical protein